MFEPACTRVRALLRVPTCRCVVNAGCQQGYRQGEEQLRGRHSRHGGDEHLGAGMRGAVPVPATWGSLRTLQPAAARIGSGRGVIAVRLSPPL